MRSANISPLPRCRPRGVALVIVLAFVVLLTGLILAFFSRAISERQISNSSANETRVDVFAQGALATVIGDLRQEIAAGSTQPFPNPTPGSYLYSPKTAWAAAPSMAGTTAADNLPNLLKRSAYNQKFYSDPSGTNTYDTTNYPPSNRAANSTSIGVSQNGRTISPARWNKPLLLPKQNSSSDTDFTPAGATTTTWAKAPDWVLVARDGTNPVAWNTGLATNGANPVVGRFAYNIYDEGGLLDANVVGFPTDTSTASPQVNYPAYKLSAIFADLKQLPGFSDLPPARQEQIIRTLTGWRNFASTGIDPTVATPIAGSPVSGNVNTGYIWSSTNILNYLNFANLNGTGFLRAANPVLVSGQSDRFLASRQQLIDLLLNSIAGQDTGSASERASLQNGLQYLGTFSRDLNQPSVTPVALKSAATPNGRPAVLLAATAGGNDAFGKDDVVNPPFLTIRVKTAFTRSDGTTAQVGEPLVKKRFPLNRLAWLNCRGPSSQYATTGNTDVLALVNAGISRQFLQLGTDDGTDQTNIPRYFGLTWDSGNHRWKYMHGSNGTIYTLDQVASLTGGNAREPDFIELLKASISAGAIAKSAFSTPTSGSYYSFRLQVSADTATDFAVIQIAANIIDQFDADSFPTRINFPNPYPYIQEFRGVENLPYLNRVRAMVVKAAEPASGTPAIPDYNAGGGDYPTTRDNADPAYTLKDTGVGVALYYPEIWNPHDWVPNASAPINGAAGQQPVNFQIVAYTDPAINDQAGFPIYDYNPVAGNSNLADSTASPGFSTRGFSFSPPQISLTEANTLMTFQVPANPTGMALFREPTLLMRPGKPTGSNFAAPGFATVMANPASPLTQFAAGGGGVKSAVTDPVLGDSLTQGYAGFYAGAFPLRWVVSGKNYGGRQPRFAGSEYSYFRLKCEDPFGTMVVYDEKYAQLPQPNDAILVAADGGYFNPYRKGMSWCAATDPRSSRFGFIDGITFNGYIQDEEPPFANGTAWLNAAEGILTTARADRSAGGTNFSNPGVLTWFFPSALGWFPGSPTSMTDNTPSGNNPTLRLGLLSQNNPNALSDGHRFESDASAVGPFNVAQYYADADGVVRRAMAGQVPTAGTMPASSSIGLPMATANTIITTNPVSTTRTPQSDSRPMVLNRPFRSTAELGYVFSGTPWKNLSFFTPESGYASLLDVFCAQDTDDTGGMIAGKVDLNTRQVPVLQALLAGAYRDESNVGTGTNLAGGSGSVAQKVAQLLVTRTTGTAAGQGPLANVSELVGKWSTPQAISGTTMDGSKSCSGFSADLTSVFDVAGSNPNASTNNIQRFRESAVRPLANAGTARVWNLLIDLVAQTGRYPQTAATATAPLNQFVVEGETRFWLHIAIDRYTGQIIDRNLEVVKE